MSSPDPIEAIIEDALRQSGLRWARADRSATRLDFVLPDLGVYIECKQHHSPRIADQMSRAHNVIAVQGIESARLLARLLIAGAPITVNLHRCPLHPACGVEPITCKRSDCSGKAILGTQR